MRYRLMASYLGGSYQAAVGPSDREVTLFAAPPPPEEHGFSPAPGGIWRKQVRLNDLDALWESRPIGSYRGEPCLVLDDLGDRLHIVYLGMDERRAGQLGYWQVDRGVFEVVVPRQEVTDLAEERHEFPITLLLSMLPPASPRALNAGDGGRMAGGQAASGPASSLPAGGQAPVGGPAGQRASLPQLPTRGVQPQPLGGQQFAGAAQPVAGAQQLPTGLPQAPAGLPRAQTGPQQQIAPQQMPGQQPPGSPQLPTAQQMAGGQQVLGAPQLPTAPQPPTVATAWHGSPVADSNGTWYYQPGNAAAAPSNAGAAQNSPGQPGGVTANGNGLPNRYGNVPQNGYGRPAVGSLQAGETLGQPSVNGLGGAAPQYVPPTPPQSAPVYQPAQLSQAAAPQQAAQVQQTAQIPQAAQMPQPTAASVPQAQAGLVAPGEPLQQVTQLAQPAQLYQPPQPMQPSQMTQPVPQVQPAPQVQQPEAQATPIASATPAPLTAPAPAAPTVAMPAASLVTEPASTTHTPSPSLPDSSLPGTAQPATATQPTAAAQPVAPSASGTPSKLTGTVRGRRAARKPRLAMSAVFADLVDMADVSRSAYAVDEEVTGAMCLFKTDGGYEVFSCAEDARHEVRFFEDEEAAYFYLFGVLAAEALRNGRLTPRRG
jgi:hypothetical protein